MTQKFLIIGASGSNGTEIIRLLKEQGHQVKTATSKKITSGEQVHLNLQTGEGLKEAFQEVDRAFFLSPSGFADQYKILAPLIDEAKKQNLKKVVLMTAIGVDASDEIPLRKAEIKLEKSGLQYNIMRPNWFMQNFNTFWLQGIKQNHKISLPAENGKVGFIDTRDIAACAVKLLTEDKLSNRAFNLTGPESLTHDQVAKAISEVVGKKITYENISPEELGKGLLAAGLPPDYKDLMLQLFSHIRAGYNAGLTNDVKTILGRDPLNFQKYAQDYKNNWV